MTVACDLEIEIQYLDHSVMMNLIFIGNHSICDINMMCIHRYAGSGS